MLIMGYLDSLIIDIAKTTRNATDDELAEIAAHVASRGFDPGATTKLGKRGAGVFWQGHTYRSNERVPNDVAHYLRHVVATPEWPVGTTLAQYIGSLQQAAGDPDVSIHLSRYVNDWQLNMFAPSRQWRGPSGAAYIVVGYKPGYGWWSTGFQVLSPFAHVAQHVQWQGGRWLRLPKLSTA